MLAVNRGEALSEACAHFGASVNLNPAVIRVGDVRAAAVYNRE
jgi:hypothetical protein